MKVIDLLNKIANGEELPKKISINDYKVYDEYTIWTFKTGCYYRNYNNDKQFLFEYITTDMLNDEVDIIEDTPKKIEHLDLDDLDDLLRVDLNYYNLFHKTHKMLVETKSKINEIIDKRNGE